MSKLTPIQRVRFFLGWCVYRVLWWPAVALAIPVALLSWAVEWTADHIAKPAFGGWRDFAVWTGNAVFGKAGRAALQNKDESR